MWTKQTRRVANIVGFLLVTVGIVYAIYVLWLRLQEPGVEGFEAPAENCTPNMTLFPGSPTYLCKIKAMAETQIAALDSYDRSTIICYTTPELTKGGRYVCYNRPPPMQLNMDLGIREPVNAAVGDDPVPDLLPDVLKTTCDSYGTIYKAVYDNLSSVWNLNNQTNWGIQTLQQTKTALSNLYVTKCTPAPIGKWTTVCNTLSNAIVDLGRHETNPKLVDAQRTTQQALDAMSSLLTTEIVPAFDGTRCPTP